MADLAGFFGRVLGTRPAAQQPGPQPYYPTPQSAPVYPQQQQYPGQQPQYQQPQQQQQQIATGEQVMTALKNQEISFGQAFQHGLRNPPVSKLTVTKAHETSNCPECGDARYFSRAGMTDKRGLTNGATPAPLCMACGYSGGLVNTIAAEIPPGTPEWNA